MQGLVLALAFLLELALLVAVGYWGFQTGTGVMAWVLGLGGPAVVAIVWGIWLAPRSSRRLRVPIRADTLVRPDANPCRWARPQGCTAVGARRGAESS